MPELFKCRRDRRWSNNKKYIVKHDKLKDGILSIFASDQNHTGECLHFKQCISLVGPAFVYRTGNERTKNVFHRNRIDS